MFSAYVFSTFLFLVNGGQRKISPLVELIGKILQFILRALCVFLASRSNSELSFLSLLCTRRESSLYYFGKRARMFLKFDKMILPIFKGVFNINFLTNIFVFILIKSKWLVFNKFENVSASLFIKIFLKIKN